MLAVGAGTLFAFSAAQAQITWGATGVFTTDSFLTLAGTSGQEVYGVSFVGGQSASGTTTTANGYAFGGYNNGLYYTIANPQSNLGFYNNYLPSGSTGDSGLNTVLNYGAYGNTSNTGTLNNLVSGQTYNVLVILDDTRSGGGSQNQGTMAYATDGVNNSANQAFSFQNASPNIGGYILGTFTASGTSQAMSIVGQDLSGNYNNFQANAILVTAVPEPGVFALLPLGGGMLMLVALRRKNSQVKA